MIDYLRATGNHFFIWNHSFRTSILRFWLWFVYSNAAFEIMIPLSHHMTRKHPSLNTANACCHSDYSSRTLLLLVYRLLDDLVQGQHIKWSICVFDCKITSLKLVQNGWIGFIKLLKRCKAVSKVTSIIYSIISMEAQQIFFMLHRWCCQSPILNDLIYLSKTWDISRNDCQNCAVGPKMFCRISFSNEISSLLSN